MRILVLPQSAQQQQKCRIRTYEEIQSDLLDIKIRPGKYRHIQSLTTQIRSLNNEWRRWTSLAVEHMIRLLGQTQNWSICSDFWQLFVEYQSQAAYSYSSQYFLRLRVGLSQDLAVQYFVNGANNNPKLLEQISLHFARPVVEKVWGVAKKMNKGHLFLPCPVDNLTSGFRLGFQPLSCLSLLPSNFNSTWLRRYTFIEVRMKHRSPFLVLLGLH